VPSDLQPNIALEPASMRGWLRDAIESGGGAVVETAEATGLVWAEVADADGLERVLASHDGLEWVQLPWAGVEPYRDVVARHPERRWTCGKGVYAEPVAEHALALALAGCKHLSEYARATTWTGQAGRNLAGARVVVLGGGGIAEVLLRLLFPFKCTTTVVRRRPEAMQGADAVVSDDQLDDALTGAELLVLALALTPETTGVIGAERLALLAEGAIVVNVARGAHIVTDDLVDALQGGHLGFAGLDVTDPEPLPDGHPLWSMPNVLITPHTANTYEMAIPLLSARVTENVRRYAAGEPLLGPVDPAAGY
jgi:phosphoglycerate dehydrogenase-like enzyme